MLLYRRGIELTAARPARNQLADLTVLCRLVLIFIRLSVLVGDASHRLTFVLVRTVCNSCLRFAAEGVLLLIKVVPLFTVTVA